MSGVPEALLDSVARVESGFNPGAVNRSSGAAGLFQFMPDTARGFGINPMNAAEASAGAGKFLRGLLVKYHGDLAKALAGYNAGPGYVDAHGMNDLPAETRAYIVNVERGMGLVR